MHVKNGIGRSSNRKKEKDGSLKPIGSSDSTRVNTNNVGDDQSEISYAPSNAPSKYGPDSMGFSEGTANNFLGRADGTENATDLSPLEDGAYDEEESFNLLNPNDKISVKDFEYRKVIGRGSFGKVYLVRKKDS